MSTSSDSADGSSSRLPSVPWFNAELAPDLSVSSVTAFRSPFRCQLFPSQPSKHRHLGSSCVFPPLYAHALIALILLFSLCVQARLGTPTLDELGREPAEDCIGLVPWLRLRTSLRTDDYENITEVNPREWRGLVYAAIRRMRPTDASAAIPSAGSQEARPKPGKKSTGRTNEETRTTLPNIPGTAASVAWTTLRGDGPAPRVERSLRGLERLQQRRNPRDDRSRSGEILPKLWLRNDGGFKLRCRWSQGHSPTAS